MLEDLKSFKDILEPRRQESSNFMWISRKLETTAAYKQSNKPSPKSHKLEVLQSEKIQEIIQKLSQDDTLSKEKLVVEIKAILDEIGFNKRIHIVRWLGLLLVKICLKVYSGIYVNEESIYKVKKIMGSTPVMFLPTHRSYADFILMSYICFMYDIEIPAIAAGMDFHAMWGMGKVLRDTGAFFMRRSFNNDSLYWDTFRQYINQIVTKGDLPIEFFVEGTRSRSCKSLFPKSGLLSMVLKPFFTSEVPDVLFVPINISYDRVLEEKLFAFELLGVPKPKESTSGFLKSLSIINERYGNIYVEFGEPISARRFCENHINRSVHNMRPLHMQESTYQEKQYAAELAHEIVDNQMNLATITTFNLIALSLTTNFVAGRHHLTFDNLVSEVIWLDGLLKSFGARTDFQDVKDVRAALNIHKELIQIREDSTVVLVENLVAMEKVGTSNLKGHSLTQKTICSALPFVMLQIYVNPVLHYLVKPAIVSSILMRHRDHGITSDALHEQYRLLVQLLSQEFVTITSGDYQEPLQCLFDHNVVRLRDEKYVIEENNRLFQLLHNILKPTLFTYYVVCNVIKRKNAPLDEKSIVKESQAQLEFLINTSNSFIHPYCLNLDTLGICLNSLCSIGALLKIKLNEKVMYETNTEKLNFIIGQLVMYLSHEEIEMVHKQLTLKSSL